MNICIGWTTDFWNISYLCIFQYLITEKGIVIPFTSSIALIYFHIVGIFVVAGYK